MTSPPDRRGYLDWLRGVGVLIMIEAHTLDSWTRPAEREQATYRWAMVVGGLGAPIFLFLAGVAIALAADARMRRGMSEHDAAARARRRAWQVFGLAFLFRLQSVIISGGGLRAFLKVDILNVMGLSMLAAALLWQCGRTTRGRVLLLGAATVLTAMLTPPIRSTPLLDWVPDALEAYVRPQPGRSTFTLLPWGGFLFGGVIAGMWLESGPREREGRRNAWLLLAGIATAGAGYAAAYLPPLYAETSYWTSSPTFFFVRLGLITAMVPLAFAWSATTGALAPLGWRAPIREMGVSSLFVYWIHVELVYGVVSTPLHKALSFPRALAAMFLFAVCMYALVRVKQRIGPLHTVAGKSALFPSFRQLTSSRRS